jgi:hypothetical protein
VLSDVLPILENLGLRVVAEEPFRIDCVDGMSVWIHEFQLAGAIVATAVLAAALERRFAEAAKIWSDQSGAIHYSCFISYSSKDHTFADRLHSDLESKGVRCWFAPHDLSIGAKTWDAIDEAIQFRDKLLIILSEASITSDWVEDEVNKAYAEERERKAIVLFPIRIDDAVITTAKPWARKLLDQRHIGDFRRWNEHSEYQKSLERLLRDLKPAAA